MAVDYRSMIYGAKDDDAPTTRKFWLLKDDKEIAQSVESALKFLYEHQGKRQTQLTISARLYGNLSLMGLAGISYSRLSTVQTAQSGRITYNVCQSVVDTITSKISKNKPKPYFLTSGGDWKLQSKAKKLGKFIDGCFYENNIYELGTDCFRDGAVWGDGCVHVYSEDGKIKAERQIISELYVDEIESFYGKPRTLYRVKNIDREVLIARFPKYKKDLLEANKARPDGAASENIADQITIAEVWHLKSGLNAKDGKHYIILPGITTLLKEDYDEDCFPFAFFKWSKRLYGFYGQGLVEQIQNIQTEINKLLWVIQRSMQLAGSFKVLVENGSKIIKEYLNNDIGSVISYTGTAPTYITPPIVPPEIYQHLVTLKTSAYEQAGISQLSAASNKPAGLNSGKALREYNDIESDRFMTVGHAYEQFYLDIAKLMIIEAKKIYSDGMDLSVIVPGKKFLETIKWSEVEMEDDSYVMQCYPVSKLPDEPAGRLQTVQELMQAGLVSPQSGRRLLDYPDLEEEEGLANAQEDLLHKILDNIAENGVYEAPEPTDNLQLAHKLVLEYISKGRENNLDEDKLELLQTFLTQVQFLEQSAAAASQPLPQQGPDAAGGAAPANPAPAPTSDLLNSSNLPVSG